MAISEFQLALIGAGAAAVVGVWAYNNWQEYRVRKAADRVFNQDREDVLVAESPVSDAPGIEDASDAPAFAREARPASEPTREFIEPRIEPIFFQPNDEIATLADDAGVEAELPVESAAIELPELPDGAILDSMIEWPVALSPSRSADELAATWSNGTGLRKRVRWVGWNAETGEWMEAATAGADLRHVHVAIQLADRQGAIEREELDAFAALAQSVGATNVALDARNEVLTHARALDDLCASLDIQIALHLVGRAGQPFAGSKVRGMLEAAGLPLADGEFHFVDGFGNSLFSVCHAGTAPFTPDQLRSGAVTDATFWLDVPRIHDGGATFDRMLATARQLAESLDGALVDDQINPLGDQALATIRAKIVDLQGQMAAHGIPAGGRRALRLFA